MGLGLMGSMAALPAQLLKLPFEKLRGKSLLKPLGFGGAALGATIGGLGTATDGRQTIHDPGPLKEFGDIPNLVKFIKGIKNKKSDTYKAYVANDYNA